MNAYRPDQAPRFMFHGTDALSALCIQTEGFRDVEEARRMKFSKPGFAYGTEEPRWAEAYARARAKQSNAKSGVVLRVDLSGLQVEDDPDVALDGLSACAYRIRLPIGPERVVEHKRVQVRGARRGGK